MAAPTPGHGGAGGPGRGTGFGGLRGSFASTAASVRPTTEGRHNAAGCGAVRRPRVSLEGTPKVLTLRRAFAAITVVLLGMSGAVGASLMEGSRAFPVSPPKPTVTAVTSSGTPSLPGATVVFTATVQRNGAGTADPTSGTITFSDGATVLGTGSVGATHQATFSTAALAMGSHSITAALTATRTSRRASRRSSHKS